MATTNRAAGLNFLQSPTGALELFEDLLGSGAPHKGLGSLFHAWMNSSMASIKSGTLAKLPWRTALPVISANQRSTRFIQLELVGMNTPHVMVLKKGQERGVTHE